MLLFTVDKQKVDSFMLNVDNLMKQNIQLKEKKYNFNFDLSIPNSPKSCLSIIVRLLIIIIHLK